MNLLQADHSHPVGSQETNPLTSLAVWRNQSLADSALVMVSWVVNVYKRSNDTK